MASPIKFAHVVLKTSRYDEMVAWWKDFLGAQARHENGFITFLSYDEEHHREAIRSRPMPMAGPPSGGRRLGRDQQLKETSGVGMAITCMPAPQWASSKATQ